MSFWLTRQKTYNFRYSILFSQLRTLNRKLKTEKKNLISTRLTFESVFKFRPITSIDKGGNFDGKCGCRVYKWSWWLGEESWSWSSSFGFLYVVASNVDLVKLVSDDQCFHLGLAVCGNWYQIYNIALFTCSNL